MRFDVRSPNEAPTHNLAIIANKEHRADLKLHRFLSATGRPATAVPDPKQSFDS